MYLDVHRQCWDADASGTPLDINTRVRLVGDSEVRTFVTAWQRAGGYDENIRVAETAIKGSSRRQTQSHVSRPALSDGYSILFATTDAV
jgi:hypothetical protein